MSVTSLQFAEKERHLRQVEKIAHSRTLRKAESLCKLLRYLADRALAQPGVPLKEYQIATEVFGRPQDFDPQADSAIRVHAGRLRLKLLEYYSDEGSADSIIVEMPPGSYALNFRNRAAPALVTRPTPSPIPRVLDPETSRRSSRRLIIAVTTLSWALATALAAVVILLLALNAARAEKARNLKAAAALGLFWSPFASGPDAPWVIFSNAAFVGRPESGMRYLDPVHDSRDLILDHYTGVGEVLAVHDLDQIFGKWNQDIRVKRGSLFSLDDARNDDLIFVGSPAENLVLRDLPGSQEFVFKRLDASPHRGELGIVNVHPEPGQAPVFYPSDQSRPLVEDYAIIALLPGLEPGRHVMILAGTTTIGTQAAVEYVCEEESVEQLLHTLAVHATSSIKPFEALLRVRVARGVPVASELLAVRHRR